jgi:hypothetical protein
MGRLAETCRQGSGPNGSLLARPPRQKHTSEAPWECLVSLLSVRPHLRGSGRAITTCSGFAHSLTVVDRFSRLPESYSSQQ